MTSATVEKKQEQNDLQEDTNEVKFYKNIAMQSLLSVATYPLTLTKTLIQLGYEPYPLSTGKVFITFGRDAYFLPNAINYLRNLYRDNGLGALYRGVEASVVSTIVVGSTKFYVDRYIDQYYPEIGGAEHLHKAEYNELSDHDALQYTLRFAIRNTITDSLSLIVARPFTVLMIREIAQHIGGEWKYKNLISGILRVGNEEGPDGLFAGLLPHLIGNTVLIWGQAALSYATTRALNWAYNHYKDDKHAQKSIADTIAVTPFLTNFLVKGWCYPFNVCSTVMAVTGSSLFVSMLPYAPLHQDWLSAYNYLKPHGLTRGARLFLREQRGAVTVGSDQRLYASNKFFI